MVFWVEEVMEVPYLITAGLVILVWQLQVEVVEVVVIVRLEELVGQV